MKTPTMMMCLLDVHMPFYMCVVLRRVYVLHSWNRTFYLIVKWDSTFVLLVACGETETVHGRCDCTNFVVFLFFFVLSTCLLLCVYVIVVVCPSLHIHTWYHSPVDDRSSRNGGRWTEHLLLLLLFKRTRSCCMHLARHHHFFCHPNLQEKIFVRNSGKKNIKFNEKSSENVRVCLSVWLCSRISTRILCKFVTCSLHFFVQGIVCELTFYTTTTTRVTYAYIHAYSDI